VLGAGTALYGRDPPTPDFLTPFTLVYGVLPLKSIDEARNALWVGTSGLLTPLPSFGLPTTLSTSARPGHVRTI